MDIHKLFLHTVDDLESCIASNDEYVILRASALIRKLFFDGDRLVDQANRPFGIKLEFEIVDTEKLSKIFDIGSREHLIFASIGDALDPSNLPNPPTRVLNRDAFFKTKIQFARDKAFTIREIVLHQANVQGGVHKGSPQDETSAAQSEAEDSITLLGLPPGLHQLRSIGRVIIKSLIPLRIAADCTRKIAINPRDAPAFYNRGVILASFGKYREAISDFDKAIEFGSSHPQIADCYYNRGHTMIRAALVDIERYLELAGEVPDREEIRQFVDRLRAADK